MGSLTLILHYMNTPSKAFFVISFLFFYLTTSAKIVFEVYDFTGSKGEIAKTEESGPLSIVVIDDCTTQDDSPEKIGSIDDLSASLSLNINDVDHSIEKGGNETLPLDNKISADNTGSDKSKKVVTKISALESATADSLALMVIYEALDGPNWTDNNWTTEPDYSLWTDLIFVNGRVTDLNLDEKGLKGEFPVITSGLDLMVQLAVRSNEITYMPILDAFTTMSDLFVSNNRLEFESLENNVNNVSFYLYSPQDSVLVSQSLLEEVGAPLVLNRTVSGSDNVYKWFKIPKGGTVAEQLSTSGAQLTFEALAETDAGTYYVEVTSNVAGLGDLTLTSRLITLETAVGNVELSDISDISTSGFTANWVSRAGATTYELQLSRVADFSVVLDGYNPLIAPENVAVISDLNFSTTYFYRVRAAFPGNTFSDYSSGIVKTLLDPLTLSDSSALMTIYSATAGPTWAGNNWEDAPRFYDWSNLLFDETGNRVSSVNLSGVGMEGDFPELTEGLEVLSVLDLSNNNLAFLPALSSLEALFDLNISQNKLDFESLENSVNRYQSYTYSPQDSVLQSQSLTAVIGSQSVLDRTVSGSDNVYTWFKIAEGATEAEQLVSSGAQLSLESYAGNYYVEVKSNVTGLGDITLISRFIKLETTPGIVQLSDPSAINTSAFTANWVSRAGATRYELELSRVADFSVLVDGYNPLIVPENVAAISGVNFSTTYYYRIRAEFSGSSFSNYSSGIVKTLLDPLTVIDSSALMTIYSATAGPSWIGNNWEEAPRFYDWSNLAFDQSGNRVSSVNLSGVGMEGDFPTLTEGLEVLSTLNLSNNNLKLIPTITLGGLVNLNISQNKLEFGSLENNLNLFETYTITNQDSVSFSQDRLLEIGNSYELDREISGSQNVYTWRYQSLEGGEITDAGSGPAITLNVTNFDPEGFYFAEVKSNVVGLTDITLISRIITVKVSSLERDVKAILEIYNTTGGPNWTNANGLDGLTIDNVSSFPDIITLTSNSDRVVGLNLSEQNLIGSLPKEVNDIGGLVTLDVSQNALTGLAALTRLTNLTNVDASNNQLDFGDLEKNAALTAAFTYAPQANIPSLDSAWIARGENYSMAITVAGTQNQYTWLLTNDVVDGQLIEDNNLPNYQIVDITYETMGSYLVEIRSDLLPALTLLVDPFVILATANLTGSVEDFEGGRLSSGTLEAFKVFDPGTPYENVGTVDVVNGTFLVENLVLGDYLTITSSEILDDEGNPIYLPTYFGNTDLWVEAGTILIREDTDIADYVMSFYPQPLPVIPDLGVITGVVETELEESGRILERRKVKKAGCSVRRFRASGRDISIQDGTWELLAYVETNDNGEFEFAFLPPGNYRFNIEFPGIPMDPDSFVEFEIGAEGFDAKNFKLEAFITADGIEVSRVPPLSTYDRYFSQLEIYPVPASETISVNYKSKTNQPLAVELIDLAGKVYLSEQFTSVNESSFTLDVSQVPNGMYLFKFIDASKQEIMTYKILVNH
jgi:hypothetical protein